MGEFVKHIPCEKCGSSDACALYEDGSTYCFSCENTGGDNTATECSVQYKPLKARNLTLKTCRKFGYSIGTYQGKACQMAPYYRKSKHVATHIRLPGKDFRWTGESKKVELFGQHLWDTGGRRLVITEGEIDCMSVSQVFDHKYPVVSIPSGTQSVTAALKDNIEFVESFDEVVLAFDDDVPGKEAVEKAVSILSPGKVRRALFNGHKDANEMLLANEGGLLPKLLWQAAPYRPDDIVNGSELWDLVSKEDVPGYGLPYPRLNEMFRGFRKGELYLFTAGSGVGKTTVAKEICHHFRTVHNLSLGVFSLEEGVKKATNGFISLSLNVPPFDIFGVPLDKRKKAFESLTADNKFWIYDHWGSSDIDRILSKIKFMAVSLGCDWILLDHISIIVSGSDELNNDERKLIDRFMTKLRTLIENTGVGVLAIVHLKRPPGDKGYTEGRKVSLSDLRGSGSLEQLSDGVIALERDQQGEQKNISQVRVLKNRPIGTTGKADVLHYDTGTGRLTNEIPTEDEIDDF